ncbi:helix-turn-helix transcriptional regulator [Roseisalinus antarcticus]|uniref:WYL domain-containing protein n=1 Tax=Roseisalinus antarcticus TaxID=254357 RepID=A0A1Y5U083_9RHOB|nr:hypothetical protein ROA7023_04552 [Roseisalinus antarcticus]
MACWEERTIDLRYRDADGSLTERRVYPLAIVYLDSGTGLLAWCCLRKDFRKFRMSRMDMAEPAHESFRPNRVRLLREYISQMAEEGSNQISSAS